MCWHGVPSFAGFPQVHVPKRAPNWSSSIGITTVNFLLDAFKLPLHGAAMTIAILPNVYLKRANINILKGILHDKLPRGVKCSVLTQANALYFSKCFSSRWIISNVDLRMSTAVLARLAPHVADVSPTCRRHRQMLPNLGRHCVSLRHRRGRPRHTQFISITTDKYKSAQTYGYLSYHRVFVFELKQQSQNYRHVGNPPTCREMSCRFGHPADTTLSCVCNMTSDVSRRRHDTECRRLGNKIDTPTSDMWSLSLLEVGLCAGVCVRQMRSILWDSMWVVLNSPPPSDVTFSLHE